MPISVPDPIGKHQVRDWSRWSELAAEGRLPSEAGFSTDSSPGDLNRFASRFRMAHAFRGVVLDGYTTETVGGYDGLLRVFLTWSAFERFLKVTGTTDAQLDSLLKPYDPHKTLAIIRTLDPQNRYFTMIRRHVNARIAKELDKYLGGQQINVTWLIRALRHIFAHGTLTPHADRMRPWVVKSICDACCDLLFRVMDTEFSRRVSAFSQQAAN